MGIEFTLRVQILLKRKNQKKSKTIKEIGSKNNWNKQELEIDFSFLPEGEYTIEIMQDGINANRVAIDYKKHTETITNTSLMKIKLTQDCGWAAIVKPQ
jgi:alpha-glucosidase